MWAKRCSDGAPLDKDLLRDEALLDEVVALVEAREKSSPTGEDGLHSPDASLKHAVLTVTNRTIEMLEAAASAGPILLDSDLLDDLFTIANEVGFRLTKDEHDRRIRGWYSQKFRHEGRPKDLMKDVSGKEMLARELVGALQLERGTGKSSQFALKRALKNPESTRNVKYQDLATYLLVVLNVPPQLVAPVAGLLTDVRTGMASVGRDRVLAPIREALLLTSTTRKALPRGVFPVKPNRD